ncbi:MAG: sensor histidine kinase [Candidatus Dormibacteria bacterium]
MSRRFVRVRLAPDGAAVTPAARELWADGVLGEIEAERHRLAERINEEPVQTLAHIARVLQSVEDAPGTPDSIAKVVREAGLLASGVSEQLRGLARGLRPPLLDDLGLGAALNQLADDFSTAAGIPVAVESGDVVNVAPGGADLVLFRVAQSALRNAERHSAANRVDIRVRRRSTTITLTVRDNGIGLPNAPLLDSACTGILEMRERLRAVGGRLAIRSRLRVGTVVLASVPCEAAKTGRRLSPHPTNRDLATQNVSGSPHDPDRAPSPGGFRERGSHWPDPGSG